MSRIERKNKLEAEIYREFANRETWVLKRIWDVHDENEWTDRDFRIVKEILIDRNVIVETQFTGNDSEIQNPVVKNVILTTTDVMEGYQIDSFLGVVTAVYLIPQTITQELINLLWGFKFRRSDQNHQIFQDEIRKAEEKLFLDLKKQAVQRGGNAVFGIRMNYPNFSFNTSYREIALSSIGTVVMVKKITTNQQMETEPNHKNNLYNESS